MKSKRPLTIILIIALAIGAIGLTGCEQYNPAEIAGLAQQTQEYNAELEKLRAEAAPILEQIEAGGIIDEDTLAKLNNIIAEIEQVQAHIDSVSSAVADYNYTQTGVGGVVETLQAVNEGSKPFNPYSSVISGVLAIIAAITGLAAKRKSTALSEVVSGIEKFKKQSTDANKLKAALSAAENISTEKQIAKIRRDINA